MPQLVLFLLLDNNGAFFGVVKVMRNTIVWFRSPGDRRRLCSQTGTRPLELGGKAIWKQTNISITLDSDLRELWRSYHGQVGTGEGYIRVTVGAL